MKQPTTGPEIFLNRLNNILDKENTLPKFKIFLPTIKSNKEINQFDGVKIGRLDGSFFYDFSKKNLNNFALLRNQTLLKNLPISLSPFNKLLNSHLNRFSKNLLESADLIIYQSFWSKKMQDKFVGECSVPYAIINNGVPLDIFSFNKKQVSRNINLVITANFRPHKRLFDAILLVNSLQNKVPKIRLKVIGDIDIVTKLSIQNLNLNNCDFLGKIPSNKAPEIYKECHIGISPAIFDPCPNSVVEMMACGLPVISCLESGASELISIPELCIDEGLKLNYLEFQTVESLPKICLNKWGNVILNVLENYSLYQDKIHEQVQKRLDIKVVSKKYIDFLKLNANA